MAAASFDTADDELWELIVAGDAPGCWAAATGGPVEAVRVAVAEATPILAHFDVLAADASPSVREAVAGNSAASYDLLIRLSNDTYDFVATAARRHM